jgi:glycosyltransferase involved in cell wall biosynthesis
VSLRVLYDLQVFAEQGHGGVSRYFRELGNAVRAGGTWEPVVPPGVHIGAQGPGLTTTGPLLRVPSLGRGFRMMRAANRALASLAARRLAPEISLVHPTWYHRPSIEVWSSKPIVLTVHDLIPETWPSVTTPEQLADRAWAIQSANSILCVSHATREDLVERFPGVAEHAFVAYPGVNPLPVPPLPPRDPAPYFVYIGKRGGYKDFATCLRATEMVGVPLVAVGGGAPSRDLKRRVNQGRLAGLVEFRAAPDDAELAVILSGATALVSTSHKEGFGMPPLEALALGTPVILSDIRVYREVYGSWALFFPPGNAADLAQLMHEVLAAPPIVPDRAELLARYSWQEAATRTERAYELALE